MKSKECKDKWMEGKCKIVEDRENNQNSQKLFRTANEICGAYSAKIMCVGLNDEKAVQTLVETDQIKKDGQNTLGNCAVNKIMSTKLFLVNYQLPIQQNTLDDFMKEEVENAIKYLKKARHQE